MTTLRIDPTIDLPFYEQVRRQLIEQIQSGQLLAQTRLPTVRRLAADLGIAPGTVARVSKELEDEGYLVAYGRNGTLVAPFAAGEYTEVQCLSTQHVIAIQDLGLEAQSIGAAVHRALPNA